MITLEDCDCVLRQAQADSSGLSILEKIYYMARPQPVDLVEGADEVWKPPSRNAVPPQRGNDERRVYGHMADGFDYFTKYAGVYWPDSSGIWTNDIGV